MPRSFKPGASVDLGQGLILRMLRSGAGRPLQPGDVVGVKYVGFFPPYSLASVFDQNLDSTALFPFALGAGEVIPGWDQGLKDVRLGSVVELTVPAELAYGAEGAGETIPPNSTLGFQVFLVGVQPPGASEPIFADPLRDFGVAVPDLPLGKAFLRKLDPTRVALGSDRADIITGLEPEPQVVLGLSGNDRITASLTSPQLLAGGAGRDTVEIAAPAAAYRWRAIQTEGSAPLFRLEPRAAGPPTSWLLSVERLQFSDLSVVLANPGGSAPQPAIT